MGPIGGIYRLTKDGSLVLAYQADSAGVLGNGIPFFPGDWIVEYKNTPEEEHVWSDFIFRESFTEVQSYD